MKTRLLTGQFATDGVAITTVELSPRDTVDIGSGWSRSRPASSFDRGRGLRRFAGAACGIAWRVGRCRSGHPL